MQINKLTALFVSLLLVISSVSVLAADPVTTAYTTVEAQQNGESWEITITGTSVQMADTTVMLNLLYPGVSLDSLGGSESLKKQSAYTDIAWVGDDGKFSFEIPLKENDIGGVYTACIYIPGEAKPIEVEVPCMNYGRRSSTLAVAQKEDATTIKEALVYGMGDLNALASRSYADYDDDRQMYVSQYIVDTRTVWDDSPFSEDKYASLGTKIGDVVDALDTIMEISEDDGDRSLITDKLAAELKDVAEGGDGIMMLAPEVLASYGALTDIQKEKAVVQLELSKSSLVYPADITAALKTAVAAALIDEPETTPSLPQNNVKDDDKRVDKVETDNKFIQENTKNDLLEETGMFTDLSATPWAADAINTLAERGILSGRGNGKFCPTDKLTRAEFAQMIVKAWDIPMTTEKQLGFTDVKYGDWYYEAAQILCNRNIIKGLSATEFGAAKLISRQDMAVMISRTMSNLSMTLKVGEAITFTDESQIASYAKASVESLTKSGILAGNADGTFAPLATATRAEAAVIIYRIMYAMNLL